MSAHKGFALPLIFAILLSIIIFATWAPWVTESFVKKKILASSPCGMLTVVPVFTFSEKSKKTFFGRTMQKVNTGACGTYDLFVSALGTVHQIKFYKLSESKALDETVYTYKGSVYSDAGTANWKTYTNTKNRYSIQYPSNLQLIVDNDRPSITNKNNGTEHYFNISIDVSDNLKNQTTQDFVNMSKILTASGEYKNPFVSPKLYTNGVIKGMISDVTNGDDYYAEVIQVNNGQIYEFKLLSGPDTGTKPTDEDKTTFDQTLSTFKFLN